ADARRPHRPARAGDRRAGGEAGVLKRGPALGQRPRTTRNVACCRSGSMPAAAKPSRIPLLALAAAGGCYALQPSDGGGDTRFEPPRRIDPADVALAPGYRIEAVATRLTFPTGVAFDGDG